MISIESVGRKDMGAVFTGCGSDFISNYTRTYGGRSLMHMLAEALNIPLTGRSYGGYFSRYAAVSLLYMFEKQSLRADGETIRRNFNFIKPEVNDTHAAIFAIYGIGDGDCIDLLSTLLTTLDIDNELLATLILEAITRGTINPSTLSSFIRLGTGIQIKTTIDKLYANAHKDHVKEVLESMSSRSDFDEICQSAIPKISAAMGGQL